MKIILADNVNNSIIIAHRNMYFLHLKDFQILNAQIMAQ